MPEPSSIVVLGGPAAGKTVYLSILYHHLWDGHDGMVMRAGSGAMHSELLGLAESIGKGTMPPATQALRHFEFELQHEARIYHLQYLDYPGELFRKVFYDMTIDSDEARELLSICETAAGVLVLVDPRSVVDAGREMDYALSNLFRFYESKPVCPQFVFAFTKRDQNQDLVGDHLASFVKRRLPHVARLLGRGMRLMHFSSIIKSKQSVQFARPMAVRAALDAILEAIEEQQIDKARVAFMRRLAVKSALTKAGWFLCILISVLCAFLIGVFLRHIVEVHRSASELPGTTG